jgi:hypothetical protein
MANMQFAFREEECSYMDFLCGVCNETLLLLLVDFGGDCETKNLRQAYILDCPLMFARKKSISLRVRREQNVL